MAGSVSGDKDVYDEINITPMLDLAYVLLVIFIIMTTATVQGIKVNLPKASAQPRRKQNEGDPHRRRRHHLSRHFPGDHERAREHAAPIEGRESEPAHHHQ